MQEPANVHSQITDGLTQANVTVLGNGPAVSVVQSYLSLAQAQGVLFANMVNNQQQLATAGHAAMTEGVIQILSLSTKASSQDTRNEDLANITKAIQTGLNQISGGLQTL